MDECEDDFITPEWLESIGFQHPDKVFRGVYWSDSAQAYLLPDSRGLVIYSGSDFSTAVSRDTYRDWASWIPIGTHSTRSEMLFLLNWLKAHPGCEVRHAD